MRMRLILFLILVALAVSGCAGQKPVTIQQIGVEKRFEYTGKPKYYFEIKKFDKENLRVELAPSRKTESRWEERTILGTDENGEKKETSRTGWRKRAKTDTAKPDFRFMSAAAGDAEIPAEAVELGNKSVIFDLSRAAEVLNASKTGNMIFKLEMDGEIRSVVYEVKRELKNNILKIAALREEISKSGSWKAKFELGKIYMKAISANDGLNTCREALAMSPEAYQSDSAMEFASMLLAAKKKDEAAAFYLTLHEKRKDVSCLEKAVEIIKSSGGPKQLDRYMAVLEYDPANPAALDCGADLLEKAKRPGEALALRKAAVIFHRDSADFLGKLAKLEKYFADESSGSLEKMYFPKMQQLKNDIERYDPEMARLKQQAESTHDNQYVREFNDLNARRQKLIDEHNGVVWEYNSYNNSFNRSVAAMQEKNYVEAARICNEILRSKPKIGKARIQLALAYGNMGVEFFNKKNYKKALENYFKAINVEGRDSASTETETVPVGVRTHVARVYFAMGRDADQGSDSRRKYWALARVFHPENSSYKTAFETGIDVGSPVESMRAMGKALRKANEQKNK